jgi:hypothetical protein
MEGHPCYQLRPPSINAVTEPLLVYRLNSVVRRAHLRMDPPVSAIDIAPATDGRGNAFAVRYGV